MSTVTKKNKSYLESLSEEDVLTLIKKCYRDKLIYGYVQWKLLDRKIFSKRFSVNTFKNIWRIINKRNLTEIRAFIKEHVNTIYNNQDSIFETGTASSSAHLPTDEKNVTENTSNLGDTCNNSEGLTLGGLSKRRLEKERLELLSQKENTIKLLQEHADKWIIQITGAENTLYSNETFQMQFKFTEKYPIESPEVIFLGQPPIHPHIYSNGHICLSILYDHWSPVLSVNSICLSIISMLSSCKKKRKPLDDILYCSTGPRISPKNMKWMFHDDKV
ncbi:hypothetical protein PFFCH_01229 [Plasmodium falciparum FCH/4]|uniref:UBC core domain-containing protein n=1 Tax=Plasmodium falciparum FCH/4 TaxID=1036724 RepID=A0A024VRF8_PLAFA|nr:hypothetical protein PFFCH_01229 [Plasmodium falciparum FCH/4]